MDTWSSSLPIVRCISSFPYDTFNESHEKNKDRKHFAKEDKRWWETALLPFSVMKSEYDSSLYHRWKHCQGGSLQITWYVSFSTWDPSLFYPPQRALCEQRIRAAKQMLRKCLVQSCWAHNRHSETVHSIKNPPHGRNRGQQTNNTHTVAPAPALGTPASPLVSTHCASGEPLVIV